VLRVYYSLCHARVGKQRVRVFCNGGCGVGAVYAKQHVTFGRLCVPKPFQISSEGLIFVVFSPLLLNISVSVHHHELNGKKSLRRGSQAILLSSTIGRAQVPISDKHNR
jgi:hypothetical protein